MRILLFLLLCLPLAGLTQTPKSAVVADHRGKPTIFVNKVPMSPHFYALTHVYGGRWSWEERPSRNLKNFCEAGIQLFQIDLYFEDIWYKNQPKLDIAKAQRQVRGVLDVCPDANVVIRVHVNAPFWWNELHREECTQFADGPLDVRRYGPPFNNEDGDTDRPLRASLASEKWREESGQKLKEFCQQFSKTPEGASVIGLHLSGGIYGEWHYWGFIDHEPDTGPAMTTYFRKWLKSKYKNNTGLQKAWNSTRYTLENASIPDTSERNICTDGIFRNPEKEQRVIDYFMAQQEVVVEDIEYFCRIAKEHWGRPLIVGVFYGYFHMTFSRQAIGGHILVERILDCPYIDYLSAPQTYWGASRELGGSGNSRGIIESTLLHKKLWLDELDNGYLQADKAYDPVRSGELYDSSYASILRRSTLLPLMRGIGLWYYDFGPQRSSGWWDSPQYLSNIQAEKEFFEQRLNRPYQSVADVLYVYDQENFYYIKNKWTPISYAVLDQGVEEAMQAGVAADHVYLFDLKRVNLAQYQAIVFVNCFKMSESERKFIKEKVAQKGRTLIWNYLAGYVDGSKNSLSHVADLTGMKIAPMVSPAKPLIKIFDVQYELSGPFQPAVHITDPAVLTMGELLNEGHEVVIGKKKNPTHTSIFATFPLQKTAVFRTMLSEAGCHIYNHADDFTYANAGLLMIHTKDGGTKRIHLKNGKTFELSIPPHSTWLLDAESGQVHLK